MFIVKKNIVTELTFEVSLQSYTNGNRNELELIANGEEEEDLHTNILSKSNRFYSRCYRIENWKDITSQLEVDSSLEFAPFNYIHNGGKPVKGH